MKGNRSVKVKDDCFDDKGNQLKLSSRLETNIHLRLSDPVFKLPTSTSKNFLTNVRQNHNYSGSGKPLNLIWSTTIGKYSILNFKEYMEYSDKNRETSMKKKKLKPLNQNSSLLSPSVCKLEHGHSKPNNMLSRKVKLVPIYDKRSVLKRCSSKFPIYS